MSLILQIETATAVCSVALAKEGVVLACKELEQRNAHAEVITVFIDELLKTTGKHYSGLDAVAVSSGPGSYTGLRIGISVAKGLCFALDIPLIAVETLEAMTDGIISQHLFDDNNTLLCPMIDARRMEVFTAVFDAGGNRIRPNSAEIIDEESFSDLLKNSKIMFFGDGAAKCADILKGNTNAQIMPGFANSASYLTKRVIEKFRVKDFEDTAYFEPYYLKDFIAGKKKT
jgi:tRNA threonylcarbamoyladenosine biosynthesis protein TsaB